MALLIEWPEGEGVRMPKNTVLANLTLPGGGDLASARSVDLAKLLWRIEQQIIRN